MKVIIILFVLLALFPQSASASEIPMPSIPDSAEEYMPDETESFAEGLWFVFSSALDHVQPIVKQSASVCLSCICIVLLCGIVQGAQGNLQHVISLCSTVLIGVILFRPANSLIALASQTVNSMIEYGNLLLPVISGALAAQGGAGTSAALYAGTALFSGVLNKLISVIIIPLLYIYACICIANNALPQPLLGEMKKFIKWLITWLLKTVLYVFIGYMSITGVVSGTADAAAVKAAKLTISGVVPVVGGIISDASETILVSAGVVKSSAGVYGLLAIAAVLVGPFLKFCIPYLMLKATGSVCTIFGVKSSSDLIQDFSGILGVLLGMTGAVALMLMVSVVCFMKGIA